MLSITALALALTSGITAQPRWMESQLPPPARPVGEELKELEGVGVTEKLRAKVPPTARFTTSEGKEVTWDQVLSSERPTILTLNYSDCPMLCTLQLDGLVAAMKAMQWEVGNQYDVITVSVDPKETPEKAARTKERYLQKLLGEQAKDPEALAQASAGWTFLVGDEEQIQVVSEAVGFGYRLNPDNGEYLHTAALILLSPKGEVSRYLYGVMYSPQTLRLSMVESADGKFASTIDPVIFYCFRYDAESGTYTMVVRNILQLGAGLTVVLLALFVGGGLWLRRARRGSSLHTSQEGAAAS